MNTERRVLLIVLAFVAVVSVRGQTVFDLRVELTRCDTLVGPIFAVRNGDDNRAGWLQLQRQGNTCVWTHTSKISFSLETARISLRLGDGRSGCHRPYPDEENELKPYAAMNLTCCPAARSTVAVESIEPEMPVGYLRIIKEPFRDAANGARNKSIACTERGWFEEGRGSVEQVAKKEEIRLQLNVQEPDPRGYGLRVDGLPAESSLTPNGIVYKLLDQRAKGQDGSPAGISPNAIEVDSLNIRQKGLKKLRVVVK